jgi:hypothetical protein
MADSARERTAPRRKRATPAPQRPTAFIAPPEPAQSGAEPALQQQQEQGQQQEPPPPAAAAAAVAAAFSHYSLPRGPLLQGVPGQQWPRLLLLWGFY